MLLAGKATHCCYMTIKDLRKGDRFQFNNDTYQVTRHWMTDEIPLIAIKEKGFGRDMHKSGYEGLEIIKLSRLEQFTLADILSHLQYLGYNFRIENNESGFILFIIPISGRIYDSFYGDSIEQLIKEVIKSDIIRKK